MRHKKSLFYDASNTATVSKTKMRIFAHNLSKLSDEISPDT